jgi:hypothetical protein
MILCISCAAGTPILPGVCLLGAGTTAAGNGGTAGVTRLFASFGLKVVYLILAAIMLCCLPLVPAFPQRFQPMSASSRQPPVGA